MSKKAPAAPEIASTDAPTVIKPNPFLGQSGVFAWNAQAGEWQVLDLEPAASAASPSSVASPE